MYRYVLAGGKIKKDPLALLLCVKTYLDLLNIRMGVVSSMMTLQ